MTTKKETQQQAVDALAALNSLREENRMSAEDQEQIATARQLLTDLTGDA